MTDTVSQSMIEKIKSSFSRQGLMETIGADITTVKNGCVELCLPIGPRVAQQHGFVHAGASFALGDSACGYAALTVMPEGSEVLTIEMKINLIAPASGARLIALGEVVRAGRRVIVTRGTIIAEQEDGTRKDVALLQGTMIPA